MSGSAADAGLDYQAESTALVAVSALLGQPLNWFDDAADIPVAVSAESGGPGDDIRIETADGRVIEAQAKHGLDKDARFWVSIERLAKGLRYDPRLRAVLIVDSSSSRTITPAFRDDLLRGGRTDGEKEITREVRAFLKEQGIDSEQAFPRLRIIQKNFENGSDGLDAAHSLLRSVVATPQAIATAWRILVDEAHKLIKHRGRRDAYSLAHLLARHVELAVQSAAPTIVAQNYCAWLARKTATYYVPGLGVSMPIESTWIQLQAMEDKQDRRPQRASFEKMIREYHEWERLADDYTRHDKLDVGFLPQFAKRSIVIGGPGSGKSTLGQRITNELTIQGRLVLFVRLKLIAKLLGNDKSFDDALLTVACEGCGLPSGAVQKGLSNPEFLVADGLDECDPLRADVAGRLKAWCDGHASCRVIVTTRPIGHDSGLLPGFQHFELLPLDRSSIREHCRRLFNATSHDNVQGVERWSRFLMVLDEDRRKSEKSVRTLAARNPLLLGFLVRLFIDGFESVRSRSDLFAEILQLMEKTSDPAQQTRPDLSSQVVNAALNTIGWCLVDTPLTSVDDLLASIEQELINKCSSGRVGETARAALRFWEASRAIERLTAGHLEAVVFVHPALGEFAAARYALQLGAPGFDAWLRRVRRQPRWYQTIMLAAGIDQGDRVIRSLIELDDPFDPCATEAKTAASALSDGAAVSSATREKVVCALASRISSPIPLVSVESALSLIPISAFAAETIGKVSTDLLDHEQEWTKLAALALHVASGNGDLHRFERWFQTFELGQVSVFARFCCASSPVMPQEAVELQHQLVEHGVRRMISERPRVHVERFFDDRQHTKSLSARMLADIEQALRGGGFERQADAIQNRHWGRNSDNFQSMISGSKQETDVLLECILAACGLPEPASSETGKDRFPLVCAVVQAMQFGESPASDAVHIRRRIDCDAITEVVRGVIAALNLDVNSVAAEAAAARLMNESDSRPSFLSPKIPIDVDWSRANKAGLNVDLLERAIRHPHISVAYAAARLVEGGAAGSKTEAFCSNLLSDGSGTALYFAAHLAQYAFGKTSAQLIWDRLRAGISLGCEHLTRVLIRSVPAEKRTELLDDVAEWLRHPGSRFASAVADSLDELNTPIDSAFEPCLRQALQYWTEQVTWCDEHEIQSDSQSCPRCRYLMPCAKAAVLRQLIKIKAISTDELINLLGDKQEEVKKVATSALMALSSEDTNLVGRLLDKIAAQEIPLSLVGELFRIASRDFAAE